MPRPAIGGIVRQPDFRRDWKVSANGKDQTFYEKQKILQFINGFRNLGVLHS